LSHSGKLFANVYICSFLHAALWFNQQGRNELGKRAQLPGRRITLGVWNAAGAANDCRGAKKSPQCHTYFLPPQDLRCKRWGGKLASCPGRHL